MGSGRGEGGAGRGGSAFPGFSERRRAGWGAASRNRAIDFVGCVLWAWRGGTSGEGCKLFEDIRLVVGVVLAASGMVWAEFELKIWREAKRSRRKMREIAA